MTALNRQEWQAACADLITSYERSWEAADQLIRQGAEQERAEIVAWLRSQGGHHDDIYEEAANDIERGAHHGKAAA